MFIDKVALLMSLSLLIFLISLFILFLIFNKEKPSGRGNNRPGKELGEIVDNSISQPEQLKSTTNVPYDSNEAKPYHYQAIGSLMSPAERSFYGVLKNAVDDKTIVFSKVRIADVIEPLATKDRKHWQKSFNKISSKHFDFVLCEAQTLSIICVIELNDRSHRRADRIARDKFVRAACKSAGLGLIEMPVQRGYTIEEVRNLLGPFTNKELASCRACGSQMVSRIAKRGVNKGKPFLACSAYPQCKNTKSIKAA